MAVDYSPVPSQLELLLVELCSSSLAPWSVHDLSQLRIACLHHSGSDLSLSSFAIEASHPSFDHHNSKSQRSLPLTPACDDW